MSRGCFNQSCKRNSWRRGQPCRKSLISYSWWSSLSKIELNTSNWRWRIFNDGKLTSKKELRNVGWILPRNFNTTSDSHEGSRSGNKVGLLRVEFNRSCSILRSNAFKTHKHTWVGSHPKKLYSLNFLIFLVRLRRTECTN